MYGRSASQRGSSGTCSISENRNTRLRLEKEKRLVTENLRPPHSHLRSPALAVLAGWHLHQSAHIVLQAVAVSLCPPSASCWRSSVYPSGTLPSPSGAAFKRTIYHFNNQFSVRLLHDTHTHPTRLSSKTRWPGKGTQGTSLPSLAEATSRPSDTTTATVWTRCHDGAKASRAEDQLESISMNVFCIENESSKPKWLMQDGTNTTEEPRRHSTDS